MIYFLCATTLFLVFVTPIVLQRLRAWHSGARVDVFAPELFLSGWAVLQLPYLYLLGLGQHHASFALTFTPWVRDREMTAMWFTLLTAAAYLLTIAGIHSPFARWIAGRLPGLDERRFTRARVRRAWMIGGAIGFAALLYFLNAIGGLRYLWANMYLRTTLGQGLGYVAAVYSTMLTASAGMLVYSLRGGAGRRRTMLVSVAVLVITMMMGSTGGRSPTLVVLTLALLMHHYCVRRRRRVVTPITALMILLMLAYVLVAPLFRRPEAFDRYRAAPQAVVTDAFESFATIAPDLSGFDRVAIMINYFTPERIWWGRSYIDLLYAPIPRTRFPAKPPVDDGVYFKEIVNGHPVVPSRSAREMDETSWPMGSYVTYMNFWIPGYLVAMFVAGAAIGGVYRYMHRVNFTPLSIFMYQFVVMNGIQFSVYGIMLILMSTAIWGLYFWCFFAQKRLAPRGTSVLPVAP